MPFAAGRRPPAKVAVSSSPRPQESSERDSRTRKLEPGEVEDLLSAVGDDLLVLLRAFQLDEQEAEDRVAEALLALAGDRGTPGALRTRFLQTVGHAVHARWAERDPLEEDDAIH